MRAKVTQLLYREAWVVSTVRLPWKRRSFSIDRTLLNPQARNPSTESRYRFGNFCHRVEKPEEHSPPPVTAGTRHSKRPVWSTREHRPEHRLRTGRQLTEIGSRRAPGLRVDPLPPPNPTLALSVGPLRLCTRSTTTTTTTTTGPSTRTEDFGSVRVASP